MQTSSKNHTQNAAKSVWKAEWQLQTWMKFKWVYWYLVDTSTRLAFGREKKKTYRFSMALSYSFPTQLNLWRSHSDLQSKITLPDRVSENSMLCVLKLVQWQYNSVWAINATIEQKTSQRSRGKIRQQNGENRFSSWNTPVGHDNAKYCKWNEKKIHFILPHQITVRNSICHS